jgi:hypothetical protein
LILNLAGYIRTQYPFSVYTNEMIRSSGPSAAGTSAGVCSLVRSYGPKYSFARSGISGSLLAPT